MNLLCSKMTTSANLRQAPCTLAIIIMREFPVPAMLLGGYRTGLPMDATTYLNLNRVAANLIQRCVLGNGEAGWQPTGQYDALVCFVAPRILKKTERLRMRRRGL